MRMPDQREVDEPAASRGRCRPAQAASVPAALLNLQRLAGNQAVSIALRKVPPPETSTDDATKVPVQRVGGVKIGFDLPAPREGKDQKAIIAGQKLLKKTWADVRRTIHKNKIGGDKTKVQDAAAKTIAIRQREKERKKYRSRGKNLDQIDARLPEVEKPDSLALGFTKFYSQLLTGTNKSDQIALLQSSEPFTNHILQLVAPNKLQYRESSLPGAAPWVDIGTLKVHEDAFKIEERSADSVRDLYVKMGVTDLGGRRKEYVKDSRGVLTRRYAYVEKNYYQMMEFFMTHKHEGRFQSYMRASGEEKPDIYEHRDEKVDLVIPDAKRATAEQPLTVEQMAVAHQKLGSGPQQRGVSLTSTPKVGATYVNTGENFRTQQGFRLKIDLHKIPLDTEDGPLLINHYGGGGVIDKSDTDADTRRKRSGGQKYPYKESSIHARELFLEHLKPEWIVEIEHHPDTSVLGTTLKTSPTVDSTTLFAAAKKEFGGEEYEKGFNVGLTSDKPGSSTDPNYEKGFKGARTFVEGWIKGNSEAPKSDDEKTAEENDWAAKSLTRAQFIYDQTMNNKKHFGKHDLFRLGYLHGRGGKSMITSHEGLKTLGKGP